MRRVSQHRSRQAQFGSEFSMYRNGQVTRLSHLERIFPKMNFFPWIVHRFPGNSKVMAEMTYLWWRPLARSTIDAAGVTLRGPGRLQ
jgi:hypothetical protein